MTRIMILKAISIALISLLLSICKCDQPPTSGFTVNLIHRDSPRSPSFDPSSTPSRRLAESLGRSVHRARHLNALVSPPAAPPQPRPQPEVANFDGHYFMEYAVGTPPVTSLGVLDTGSDLTWTQCKRCRACFEQDLPIFNPMASSTYKQVRCHTPQCANYRGNFCSIFGNNCRYSFIYGDGMFSAGALATDTITLAPNVSIPGMVFGCGSINSSPSAGGESGLVGLGAGKGSFINQLGPMAQGKFSYCLVSVADETAPPSKLNFGEPGVVSGAGAVATPLATRFPDTFYFLTLEGISIGEQRLGPPRDPAHPEEIEGNIIIDSGTTQMMLPPAAYEEFESVIRSVVKLEEVGDPRGVLRLCYVWQEDMGIPEITMHFRGADVKLEQGNIFARMSDDLVCLAVAPTPVDGMAIYGNLAQVNFLVGYDLVNRTVTFKPVDCGKQ